MKNSNSLAEQADAQGARIKSDGDWGIPNTEPTIFEVLKQQKGRPIYFFHDWMVDEILTERLEE